MEEGEEDEDDMFVGPPEREDSDFLVLWHKNYQERERSTKVKMKSLLPKKIQFIK